MLILNGKVPKVGQIYVAGAQLWVSRLETVPSFGVANESIELLTPGPEIHGGDQLLLLEKDLLQSQLVKTDQLSDCVIYKFLLLKEQQVVYWKAATIILPSVSVKDPLNRAEHNFSFSFMTLKSYLELKARNATRE